MTSPALDRTLETLELMAQAEETIERLYETCAGLWQENGDFWQGLAGEEKCHAEIIRTMAAMLSGNPGSFQAGRPFSAGVLKTFISGIEHQIENVQRLTVPEVNAMRVALDIEQALIEARYAEVVKTDDRRFQDLANEIVRETAVHRRLVEKKLVERQASPGC
jgi:hypothetical protein